MHEKIFEKSIKKGLDNLEKIKKEKETIHEILKHAKSDIKDFYEIDLKIEYCASKFKISLLNNNLSIIDVDMYNKYISSNIKGFESQTYKNKEKIIEVLNEIFESFEFVNMMKEVDL